MRSIRAFWSWLIEEEIIASNPFPRLKIPKPPKKITATFSPYQIELLLGVMSSSAEGYRDMVIILALLDTGLRVNELINLKIDNVWLEEGQIKVLGKGNKERLVPIGKQIRKLLWCYITQCRSEPARPNLDNLFLTRDGRPLTKNRVDSIIKRYGKTAGFTGVRCSPHTLRHTFCIQFLRNGANLFSLQQMTGTDAEACAYLYTAALTNPMDHDWGQIYLYIATQTYRRWGKNEMPSDIAVDSLNDEQVRDLNRLKEWLYRKRTQIRLERDRAERRQKREEEAAKMSY
jgi:site-specific recombinase XerD